MSRNKSKIGIFEFSEKFYPVSSNSVQPAFKKQLVDFTVSFGLPTVCYRKHNGCLNCVVSEDHVNVHTHTHRCAFTNSKCFSLTATVLARHQTSTTELQPANYGATGEFCVLNLPKPIHIAVILNWHFHGKEPNHFVVNKRLS